MERLTKYHKKRQCNYVNGSENLRLETLFDNEFNIIAYGNAIDKLSKLEDIMEKYNIESVEEIEALVQINEYETRDTYEIIELKNKIKVLSRAYEMACDSIFTDNDLYENIIEFKEKEGYEDIGVDNVDVENYFIEQARKELGEK